MVSRRSVFHLIAFALLAVVALGLAEPWAVRLELVASFRLHAAVMAAGLAVLALTMGARSAAVIAGGTAVLGLATLGALWQAPERAGPEGGRPVTVLFANVFLHNPDPATAQQALVAQGSDVVAISEGAAGMRGGALDAAYRHHFSLTDRGGHIRNAIWSRYPLDATVGNLNDNIAPLLAGAVVRVDARTRLGVMGVHFIRAESRAEGDAQLRGFARRALALEAPLVVVGDFNASVWSNRVRQAAEMTGTVPAGGYRVTWRGRYPLGIPAPVGHQIDHLLAAPEIGIASLKTFEIPGSDHRGLLAELIVPPGDAPEIAEEPLSATAPEGYLARQAD